MQQRAEPVPRLLLGVLHAADEALRPADPDDLGVRPHCRHPHGPRLLKARQAVLVQGAVDVHARPVDADARRHAATRVPRGRLR